MNELLINLLSLRNMIKHNGWIVIPPNDDNNLISVRVEWYLDEKHTFGHAFILEDLARCQIDLVDLFIADANAYIEHQLRNGADS